MLGRPRERCEESQQLPAVADAGVLLEGPPQGTVHRLGLPGDPVDIGGEEGEGVIVVALVLGQMEAHPADQPP